jgi:hypothetical protein
MRGPWRSLIVADKTLPDRAQRILRAFELEPQSEPAFRAVRDLGPADPWYVHLNAGLSIALMYIAIYLWFDTLPVGGAIAVTLGVAALLMLRLVRTVRIARRLPPESRHWRRYADDIQNARVLRKHSKGRRITRVRVPPDTVLESTAGCHCVSLNVLAGQLAEDYAWLHLVGRPVDGHRMKEFVCPNTLVRWLGIESHVGVPQLCRLDVGTADLDSDLAAGLE